MVHPEATWSLHPKSDPCSLENLVFKSHPTLKIIAPCVMGNASLAWAKGEDLVGMSSGEDRASLYRVMIIGSSEDPGAMQMTLWEWGRDQKQKGIKLGPAIFSLLLFYAIEWNTTATTPCPRVRQLCAQPHVLSEVSNKIALGPESMSHFKLKNSW